jgi:hypothetical protein
MRDYKKDIELRKRGSDFKEQQGYKCTDPSDGHEQWVKKITDTRFEVYEQYIDQLNDIELLDYSPEEVLSAIRAFGYKDIQRLQEIYGEDSNQVIAECLSELGE